MLQYAAVRHLCVYKPQTICAGPHSFIFPIPIRFTIASDGCMGCVYEVHTTLLPLLLLLEVIQRLRISGHHKPMWPQEPGPDPLALLFSNLATDAAAVQGPHTLPHAALCMGGSWITTTLCATHYYYSCPSDLCPFLCGFCLLLALLGGGAQLSIPSHPSCSIRAQYSSSSWWQVCTSVSNFLSRSLY